MSRRRSGSLELRYGTWWARLTVCTHPRTRRWVKLGRVSEDEARAKLRELVENGLATYVIRDLGSCAAHVSEWPSTGVETETDEA